MAERHRIRAKARATVKTPVRFRPSEVLAKGLKRKMATRKKMTERERIVAGAKASWNNDGHAPRWEELPGPLWRVSKNKAIADFTAGLVAGGWTKRKAKVRK